VNAQRILTSLARSRLPDLQTSIAAIDRHSIVVSEVKLSQRMFDPVAGADGTGCGPLEDNCGS
jgi:hypothetical protein